MKTKKELNVLKEEVENANKQRRMLTDEELEQVTGGYSVDMSCCDGCKICIGVCPIGAIHIQNGKAHINGSDCVECGKCCNACPNGAIMPF